MESEIQKVHETERLIDITTVILIREDLRNSDKV